MWESCMDSFLFWSFAWAVSIKLWYKKGFCLPKPCITWSRHRCVGKLSTKWLNTLNFSFSCRKVFAYWTMTGDISVFKTTFMYSWAQPQIILAIGHIAFHNDIYCLIWRMFQRLLNSCKLISIAWFSSFWVELLIQNVH